MHGLQRCIAWLQRIGIGFFELVESGQGNASDQGGLVHVESGDARQVHGLSLCQGVIASTHIGVGARVDILLRIGRIAMADAHRIRREATAHLVARHEMQALFHGRVNLHVVVGPGLAALRHGVHAGDPHRCHGVQQPHELHAQRNAGEQMDAVFFFADLVQPIHAGTGFGCTARKTKNGNVELFHRGLAPFDRVLESVLPSLPER
ncbi:hypothetical protein D9M72_468530 [compost metagenome]